MQFNYEPHDDSEDHNESIAQQVAATQSKFGTMMAKKGPTIP